MKKKVVSFIAAALLAAVTIAPAQAASLTVNNTPAKIEIHTYQAVSYVPLRATTNLICPEASVTWENGAAVIRQGDLLAAARPGSNVIEANGRLLYVANGVKLIDGVTMVPVRVLASVLGAAVNWDSATGAVTVSSGSGVIVSSADDYNEEDVYWLSRIISAESGAEPLQGKIAVGNVILNRVKSADFPDTIYNVIFDDHWGIQFEPVKNGTIYRTPDAESVLAAKLCLDGASVVGDSLYFLNPALSSNFWITENRAHLATIGNHAFYA